MPQPLCARNKEKWAQCYRSTRLVLGMSATQRVEGFFGRLKSLVGSTSSLSSLSEAITGLVQQELAETNRCARVPGLCAPARGRRSFYQDIGRVD